MSPHELPVAAVSLPVTTTPQPGQAASPSLLAPFSEGHPKPVLVFSWLCLEQATSEPVPNMTQPSGLYPNEVWYDGPISSTGPPFLPVLFDLSVVVP